MNNNLNDENINPNNEVPASTETTTMQNPVPPITQPNSDDSFIQKKSEKGLVIAIAAIVLILGSLGAYYFYSRSEKVILKNSTKLLGDFSDYIQTPYMLDESKEYSTKGNMSMKINSVSIDSEMDQFVKILNDMTVNYDMSLNETKTLMNFEMNKGDKTLAGAKIYTTPDAGYIFLDKIFDKYIENEELKTALSARNYNNDEDYEYVFSIITDSFIKNIDNKDMEKGKAKININGKEKSVNSLMLVYNDKEMVEMLDLVISDIKSNKKANDIVLSTYPEFNTLNIKESLTTIDEEHMGTYKYTVYTNTITAAVEGIDFEYNYYEETYNYDSCEFDEESNVENMNNSELLYEETEYEEYTDEEFTTDYEDCMVIDYTGKKDTVEYRKDNNDKIYIKENGELLGYAELVKNKDLLTVNMYNKENKKVGELKITSNNELFKIEFNFENEGEELKFTLTTNIKEVTKGKEYNLDTTATLIATTDKIVNLDVAFKVTSNIKNSATVEQNITEAVKYDELTEEQKTEILTNLMTIIGEAVQ